MLDRHLKNILTARVYDVAIETPLDHADQLSERLDNHIYLKREDLQPVFSFKLRGAYNRMAQLTDAEREHGVIAASAGNHAQGVALSARHLGIPCRIVMPKTTPPIKVQAVQHLGAEIILHGNHFDEANLHAQSLAAASNACIIPPYDDDAVIAGQGTIAMELLRQLPKPPDAIFVPVGGGGLIAGIAAYFKALNLPTRIIGVEPEDAACLHAALQAGRRVTLPHVGLFADGVAVQCIGKRPFAIAQHAVDQVVKVSSDELCAAIKDNFNQTRAMLEPAGALALAGIKKFLRKNRWHGKHLVAINSGANLNFDRLSHIAERTLLGERREALLSVLIAEQKGSFKRFCHLLGPRPITEFNYRYHQAGQAPVFVGVELQPGKDEKTALIQRLREHDYPVQDMSENELALLHGKYLVGGHAQRHNERLYRFSFPERPGALLLFLTKLDDRWNISLFHYRNHGAAYGRVLLGIEVPEDEVTLMESTLRDLDYQFTREPDNPFAQLFLS